MKIKIDTKPNQTPIGIPDVVQFSRLDTSANDPLLATMIPAAVERIESYIGRAVMGQTWTLYLPAFSSEIIIPLPPLRSIVSVKYTDEDGVEQTLSSSTYQVDDVDEPARIYLAPDESWPDLGAGYINPVRIQFIAGYSDPTDDEETQQADVPEDLRLAVMQYVSYLYEKRLTASGDLPNLVQESLAGYVVGRMYF